MRKKLEYGMRPLSVLGGAKSTFYRNELNRKEAPSRFEVRQCSFAGSHQELWLQAQTNSSGLISGEYGGRKNSLMRSFTPAKKCCTDLALCAGKPSTTRNIFRG